MPGKGIGMTATAPIPLGALIISERPLFSVPLSPTNTAILREVARLSPENRAAFLALHNAHPISEITPFLGIFRTNSFGLGVDAVRGGLFEICSRFNHSCSPNAMFTWNHKTLCIEIHAADDIPADEEITINYLDDKIYYSSHHVRQSYLRSSYRFGCQCITCGGPPEALSLNDQQRAEMSKLDDAIGDNVLISTNPSRALKFCRQLLRLREAVGPKADIAKTHYDAFQVCVAHGDLARASTFARLYVENKKLYEGDAADIDGQRGLVEKPELHRLYKAVSNRWRSNVGYARDPRSNGFEEWLWMRSE